MCVFMIQTHEKWKHALPQDKTAPARKETCISDENRK